MATNSKIQAQRLAAHQAKMKAKAAALKPAIVTTKPSPGVPRQVTGKYPRSPSTAAMRPVGKIKSKRQTLIEPEPKVAARTTGLTREGLYDPDYVPQSAEEALGISDPYMSSRRLASFYKEKGLPVDPKIFPESFEEEFELFTKDREKEKSLLERQINTAKRQTELRAEAQKGATKAALIPGREGVTSAGNILASGEAVGRIDQATRRETERLTYEKDKLRQMQEAQTREYVEGRADMIRNQMAIIAQAETDLLDKQIQARQESMNFIELLQKGNALAGLDPESIAYLEQGLPGVPEGVISLLSNSATRTALREDRQVMFDQQLQVVNSLKDMAAAGIELSPEMMMNFSIQTGLPFETVYNFNKKANQVMQSNELDTMQKGMEMQKLGYELDRESRGIVTQQLINVDYLTNLYRQGASQQEIAFVKNAFGMKDMDDPMYRAQVNEVMLKNNAQRVVNQYLPTEKQIDLANKSINYAISEIDLLMKGEDWKHYPEVAQLNIQELKNNLMKQNLENKKDFGTSIYQSTVSQFPVELTENGIRLDVKQGSKGGECGHFVNNYLAGDDPDLRLLGNTYDSKMKWADPNISKPSPGMAFIAPYKTSGHTGIVEEVFFDSTGKEMMQVVESNYKLDGKIGRRIMPVADASGFILPPSSELAYAKPEKALTITEKLQKAEGALPDPYKWIGSTMNIAFGSEKAPQETKRVVDLVSEGRGEEAKNMVYNALMKEAPPDKVALLTGTIESFEKLDEEFEKFKGWAESEGYAADASSQYMNKVMKWARERRPAEYVAFERRINKSFAEYLKMLSGTAVSESEAKRIKELFGDPNKPLSENQISMDQLREEAEREMDHFTAAYTDRQFTSWQKMNDTLNDLQNLRAEDLQIDTYKGYERADIGSYYRNTPGTYSYQLEQITAPMFDSYYYNAI